MRPGRQLGEPGVGAFGVVGQRRGQQVGQQTQGRLARRFVMRSRGAGHHIIGRPALPQTREGGVRSVLALLSVVVLLAFAALPRAEAAGAHDFGFVSIEGEPLPLSGWQGKPVLVVNTASFCGYTRQYAGLVELWRRYRERGLVVLGVPSNDFGGQEPGSAGEIKEFCEVNFDVDFPLTEKQTVKGAAAHPFFRWAAAEREAPGWNFHKYLIGPDGRMLASFPSGTEPMAPEMLAAVERALARP